MRTLNVKEGRERERERETEVWTDDRFGHITHAGRTAVGMG